MNQLHAVIISGSLLFALLPGLASAQTTVTNLQSGSWSDVSIWDAGRVPAATDAVIIADGTTVTYDVSSEEVIDTLDVIGELAFSTTQPTRLVVDEVLVTGTWRMGSAANPLTADSSASIEFSGDTKQFEVMEGNFFVYGAAHDVTWTRLDTTAVAGAETLHLKKAVDWQVGDDIVIAPTGYRASEAEQRTITAISEDKREISLDAALQYQHLGERHQFAEVGLLSHVIQFQGQADSDRAGHIMFMGDSQIEIQGARFDELGYDGVVARYPLHFHVMGDAAGSFIRQVAITNSYNRCITVHATSGVVIEDAVAYNTIGHCYFLEDGTEEDNQFIHNLGVYTRAGTTIESDSRPATFWITNPANTFEKNSAAGSASFGFWFNVLDAPTGLSAGENVVPSQRRLQAFNHNTTHSNGQHGLTIDGHGFDDVSYQPTSRAVFRNITAFKNRSNGIWMRGQRLTVTDSTLVGNRIGLVFAGKYNRLYDSVVVGDTNDDDFQETMDYLHGVEFYDGPMRVRDTRFKHFTTTAEQIQAALSGKPGNIFPLSPNNSFRDLQFDDAQKFYLADVKHNGELFTVITNKRKQYTLLPLHPFHQSPSCEAKQRWQVYKCDKIDYGKLTMTLENEDDADPAQTMKITRRDTGARAQLKAEGPATAGRFIMNVPVNTSYATSLKNSDQLRIRFEQARHSITLRLKYTTPPDRITRDGQTLTDWTYDDDQQLVVLTIDPDHNYRIMR